MSRVGNALRALFAEAPVSAPEATRSQESQAHGFEFYVNVNPPSYASPTIDDLIERHGIAPYREMRRRCDAVASGLALPTYARLSTELKISASTDDELDEDIAAANRENFERAGGLLRYQEAGLDCLGIGFACIEKRWGEPEEWTAPSGKVYHLQFMRALVPIPQETIAIKRDRFGEIEPDGIWQSNTEQIVTPSLDPTYFDKFSARDFVVFSWQRQWDSPYGMSLLRPAYRWYVFKDQVIRAWQRYLERFGFPLLRVKVDKGVTYAERHRILTEVNKLMFNQGAVGHADIEPIELSHSTVAKYEDAVHEANRSIMRACLQPALLMENQGQTGSNALGSTQQSTFAWPIENLGMHVEQELVRKGVVEDFTRWNFGPQVAIPQVRYEDFQNKDLIAIATMMEAAQRIGIVIPDGWARTTLGVPEPKDDEDVLEPREKPMPTFPNQIPSNTDPQDAARLAGFLDGAVYASHSKDPEELRAFLAGQAGPALNGTVEALR
ncbi:MAG: DUF935 family protein [Candidatus Eisenbacteria bacterium]|uniref:DUF935 family protein n=1 Tax=Eiseniibacteriota bacterium TaxID=2212470 RepID=A0A956LUZ9_UNCEI|nr:DUF935 family protein [Candidatus Eisenbacteria bacterium]